MLTDKEMLEIAEKHVEELGEKAGIPTIIFYEGVTNKEYGNIYGYTSKKYYETKDEEYAVAGNAPFLVEKETGKIVTFGTAFSDEYYIKEYEEGRLK